MDAYTSFAQVYDLFMDNVPYEKWCDFIDATLQEYGIEEPILLDLGCGTGTMTRIMSDKGYDMIGVDYSAEMLDIARELEYEKMAEAELEAMESEEETIGNEDDENIEPEEMESEAMESEDLESEAIESEDAPQDGQLLLEELEDEFYYDSAYAGAKSPTLYLCQDMRELELYGTIGACYCACDSLNYIMDEADVCKVFKLVNNYLYPKGLFIFDINTPYKYEKLLADNTIAENRPEGSFIWENFYDESKRVNVYDLTLFIRGDLVEEEDEWMEADAWPDEERIESEHGDQKQLNAGSNMPELVPYYKFQETHYQKCYTLVTIKELLAEAGMEFIAAYDSYSKNPVRQDSEKITIIAREHGKRV